MSGLNVVEMKNAYLKFVAEEKEKFGKKWSKPIQWVVTAFNLVIALAVMFLFFFEQIELLTVGFLFTLGYVLACVTWSILIWVSTKTLRSALLGLANLIPSTLLVIGWIGLACYVISLTKTLGLLLLSVPIIFAAPMLLERIVRKVVGEYAKFTITEEQFNEGWEWAEANEEEIAKDELRPITLSSSSPLMFLMTGGLVVRRLERIEWLLAHHVSADLVQKLNKVLPLEFEEEEKSVE